MIDERINVDSIQREVQLIQSGRLTRNLAGKPPSSKVLYEAIAKDIANRARLTELRSQLTPEIGLLNRALANTESHVRYAYSDELSECGSTAEARKMILRRVLQSGHSLRDTLDVLVSGIDYTVKDIDQSSFGTSNLVKILMLLTERPGHVA